MCSLRYSFSWPDVIEKRTPDVIEKRTPDVIEKRTEI